MAKILGSPSRYIQGAGELQNLAKYVSPFGKKAFIVITESGKKRIGDVISGSFTASECEFVYDTFHGECSKDEINRLKSACEASGCDVIVGVGGGKAIDSAKAAAYYAGVPVVVCPTIAATDAPCSALSVIYTPDGVFEEYLFMPSNPNAVLVDTEVCVKAPVRLLVSGMGDALATVFEARSAVQKEADNCVGGKGTMAALALAELCYKTLLAQGVKAKAAAEQGVCTPAVEQIIEANTLLSGIGFESAGLAGAHAVHNGLTAYEETHSLYHGEKVAFGTLVQLILEDYSLAEIEEVVNFCISVGLPVTLEDLGITAPDPKKLMKVAELSCAENDTMGNLKVTVGPSDVYAAILAADALGHQYK